MSGPILTSSPEGSTAPIRSAQVLRADSGLTPALLGEGCAGSCAARRASLASRCSAVWLLFSTGATNLNVDGVPTGRVQVAVLDKPLQQKT